MTEGGTATVQGSGRSLRLSRELVVEAAVSVVDQRGMPALTMARVARALEVTPMALYGYVADKEDMVSAVIARLSGEVPIPEEDGAPWDETLAKAMRQLRQVLIRHPGLGHVLADQPLRTPTAVERAAACLRVLRRAGFGRHEAVRAYYALLTYTIGFNTWELPREHAFKGPGTYADALHGYVQQAPESSRDVLTDLLPALQTCATEAQFEYGLRRLLDGIAGSMSGDAAGDGSPGHEAAGVG